VNKKIETVEKGIFKSLRSLGIQQCLHISFNSDLSDNKASWIESHYVIKLSLVATLWTDETMSALFIHCKNDEISHFQNSSPNLKSKSKRTSLALMNKIKFELNTIKILKILKQI